MKNHQKICHEFLESLTRGRLKLRRLRPEPSPLSHHSIEFSGQEI